MGLWICAVLAGMLLVAVLHRASTTPEVVPRVVEKRSSDGLSAIAADLAAEKAAAEKASPLSESWSSAVKRDVVPDGEKSGRETEETATKLKPMWGLEHAFSSDVVMALGFGYSRREFARFVSTLRRTRYAGDIVLATEPEERMKSGVADYLRGEGVLAYGFEYSCVKKKKRRRLLMTPAGCQLTNWYAKGDQRGPRPLALARYEMYRSWLQKYAPNVWAFVFDFRDTFFQRNPFDIVDRSPTAPNLHLFAENRKVKTVGNCVFNSGWLRCWGKHVPKVYANSSVVCSGSTMGTREALAKYTDRMIAEFDKMKCHTTPARTESDQGYHNYLYDSGELSKLPGVRVVHHEQGYGGLVNTIGAMNGFRVPKHMKGPLDTFWKIRDDEGFLLEYDGQRSSVVHQLPPEWDRFHSELVRFIDNLVNDYDTSKKTRL
ncbi:hypothetical protein CTAYLR_006037 [Chrysophaeum taylorii]|uniref:Uncharacterized protein n=1 Tax=Chrysophaeum taylorii TaxID=2483200 RepID=A0AAD7ULE0_9STRA|nr:hypothetical protein CTAYLR_006037 [Chrysophaeum taylorii]